MNKRRGEVEEEPSQKRRWEGARKEGKKQALLPCWGMQVLSLLLSPWRRLSQPRRAEEAKGSSRSSHGLSLSLPPSTLKSSSRRRLPRLQVAASSGWRHSGMDDARRPSRRRGDIDRERRARL